MPGELVYTILDQLDRLGLTARLDRLDRSAERRHQQIKLHLRHTKNRSEGGKCHISHLGEYGDERFDSARK